MALILYGARIFYDDNVDYDVVPFKNIFFISKL